MRFDFQKTNAYERVRKNLIKDLPNADEDIENVENIATNKPDHGVVISGSKYASESKYTIRKLRGQLKSSKNKGQSAGLRFIYLHLQTSIIPLLIYNKGQFKQEKDVKAKVRAQLVEVKQELEINDE